MAIIEYLPTMNLSENHMRFWMVIPILLILPILYPADIDLIVYIDQYTISMWSLILSLSVFLFLSGIGYYFLKNREMNDRMTKLHKKYIFYGLSICVAIFLTLLFKNRDLSQPPDISNLSTFTLDQFLALTFMMGTFIVFIGTMYYVINVIVTTFFTAKTKQVSPKKEE